MRRIAFFLCSFVPGVFAEEWPQFRGVNSTGLSNEANLPLEFGPGKNMAWETRLPLGHSSPVFSKTQIFLTGFDE